MRKQLSSDWFTLQTMRSEDQGLFDLRVWDICNEAKTRGSSIFTVYRLEKGEDILQAEVVVSYNDGKVRIAVQQTEEEVSLGIEGHWMDPAAAYLINSAIVRAVTISDEVKKRNRDQNRR